jgi:hypothetical protein
MDVSQLWHMRTTVELPDELLTRAKVRALASGVSLKQFFIDAIERSLEPANKKVRRTPPAIGSRNARAIGVLTAKQIDEAMFG